MPHRTDGRANISITTNGAAARRSIQKKNLGSIEWAGAAAWFLIASVFGGNGIAAAGSLVSAAVPAAVSFDRLGKELTCAGRAVLGCSGHIVRGESRHDQ